MTQTNAIQFYDLDGTLIDSMAAIFECQLDGLVSAIGKPRSELEGKLKQSKLEAVLSENGVSLDQFYKEHYKTFDPLEAKKKGNLYVFPDAKEALEQYLERTKVIISNSSLEATQKKLEATGIADRFDYVFAEFERDKSKPSAYMGERAIEALNSVGKLSGNPRLVLVGDDERDIKFGEALKSVYSNLVNLLLDRTSSYRGSAKPDAVINSLIEMGGYEH